MSERVGMSALLWNQAQRIVSIVTDLRYAIDAQTRTKLYAKLLLVAADLESISDSAGSNDPEDGIDLAELRRNALPDGSIPAQVLNVRDRKDGE